MSIQDAVKQHVPPPLHTHTQLTYTPLTLHTLHSLVQRDHVTSSITVPCLVYRPQCHDQSVWPKRTVDDPSLHWWAAVEDSQTLSVKPRHRCIHCTYAIVRICYCTSYRIVLTNSGNYLQLVQSFYQFHTSSAILVTTSTDPRVTGLFITQRISTALGCYTVLLSSYSRQL